MDKNAWEFVKSVSELKPGAPYDEHLEQLKSEAKELIDSKEWLEKATASTVEGVGGSTAFINIFSKGSLEESQCLLQMGAAVLMDKPIFLMVTDDTEVPKHLVKIASVIERIDKNDPASMDRAKESIHKFLKKVVDERT